MQPGWPLFAVRKDPGWLHQIGKRKLPSLAARKVPHVLSSFPASLRQADPGNLHSALHGRKLLTQADQKNVDVCIANGNNRCKADAFLPDQTDAEHGFKLLDFVVGDKQWKDVLPADEEVPSLPDCADPWLDTKSRSRCQELARGYQKSRQRQCGGARHEPLCFDFNLVFNGVVLLSNAAVMVACLISGCGHCSCLGWVSGLVLINVVCPGLVVTLDTLPAELGAYLLVVMAESVLWLIVAALRLREAFEKQSEFVLALTLYSVCTSYVAWSGPALYVEVSGASLDSRLGVVLTMAMQTCSYALLEKVLAHERARQNNEHLLHSSSAYDSGRSRSGSPERNVMPAEALAVMSELLTADGALEASSGRPAAHSEGRELATQAESVRTSCGLGRHGGGRRCSGDPKTGRDAPKTENCEPKTENQGQLDESKEGRLLCAVCAEPLADEEEEQEVRRLGWCGHMFHRACIDPWLLFHSASCPLCRRAPEL